MEHTKIPPNADLYEQLRQLSTKQWKMLYAAFVHYWVSHKLFISKQNFFNMWCECNLLCHEIDDSFPDPYDDSDAIKHFCHYHPYYFIDKLPLDWVARLFATYVDNRVDILNNFVKFLRESDIRTAYTYMNDALGLSEPIDILVSETETHVQFFSY